MRRAFALLLVQVGCLSPTGGLPLETSESGEGVSAGSTSVVVVTSSGPSSSSSSSSSGVGTSGSTEASGGSGWDTDSFLVGPDVGVLVTDECDVGEQDCPAGQKCSWAHAEHSRWGLVMMCVPLARDPLPPGAACAYDELHYLDGIDDCAAAAICLDTGDGSGTGVCKQLCEWEVLVCPENAVCVGGRTLNWCEPYCDPFVQDCPKGERCDLDGGGTLCGWDEPEQQRHAIGEACIYAAQCQLGATCIEHATLGCEDTCCTPFCRRDKPDPNCLSGQKCVEPYAGWDRDTGQVDIGVCRLGGS